MWGLVCLTAISVAAVTMPGDTGRRTWSKGRYYPALKLPVPFSEEIPSLKEKNEGIMIIRHKQRSQTFVRMASGKLRRASVKFVNGQQITQE